MQTNIQKTHTNYIIVFSDNTIKIGTTRSGIARINEVVKNKIKGTNTTKFLHFLFEDIEKDEAFRAERDACYRLKIRSAPHSREWFISNNNELVSDYMYIRQIIGMFRNGVRLKRGTRNDL